ncbi:MAG: CoA transferase [Gammaproteobacteria bacterium]
MGDVTGTDRPLIRLLPEGIGMLTGHRVLDCSDRLGWLAGRVLADLGAEVVKIEPSGASIDDPEWQACNVNKRLLIIDIDNESGRQALDSIMTKMDIVILCAQPGKEAVSRFNFERLSRLNRNLILVRITPFGNTGPRAHWRATDIELMAAGGAMSLAGEPDSTPVRISIPQSYAWTGVQAAVGALLALNARRVINRGQEVQVSAQACILPALAHAPVWRDMTGTIPARAGSFTVGRSITGARYRAFWPCKDGYLNFIVYGGSAGRRTNKQLLEWMRASGSDPGILDEIDWDSFDPVQAGQAEVDAIEGPIARFFATLTKREFLEGASERELLGYPVFTVADIAADPQLQARQFWNDLPGTDGRRQRHCGVFYLLDGKRPPLKQSLSCGDKNVQTLLEGLGIGDASPNRDTEKSGPVSAASTGDALYGVKVVEFGGYAAGPQIGKILANFGASVVHVESPNRPDGFRLEYPPFKDGKPGLNRGGCFAYFNDSKYAVTLDVKKTGGLELARRLMEWADVVIENMRPGAMARLGLGYDTFAKTHPDLVMLSTCNMGQTGPRAHTPGFGSQLSALAGFSHLTGMADGPPMLLYGPYIDFIASNFGAAAVLAALEKSRRTGTGCWIDLSQYETGLFFLGGALLDYHNRGVVAKRAGNFDPVAVPHGAYRCRDDRWLTLSCWSDDEFNALITVMGHRELADDPRFTDESARKDNEEVLNDILEGWCRVRDAHETACDLQNAGVHACPVNTIADIFSDPQLRQLRVWRWRRHPLMGKQVYLFSPYDLSETPGDVTAAAPLFGGDNDVVFQDFLGLSDEEYEAYQRLGVIGTGTLAAAPGKQKIDGQHGTREYKREGHLADG